jgi:hypothetical protein
MPLKITTCKIWTKNSPGWLQKMKSWIGEKKSLTGNKNGFNRGEALFTPLQLHWWK